MNPIDEQLNALVAMLKAQGAVVGIDPNAPDAVKRAFIESILDCDECRETVMGKQFGQQN